MILMCSDGVHRFHQHHLSPLGSNSQMTLLRVSLKLAETAHTLREGVFEFRSTSE